MGTRTIEVEHLAKKYVIGGIQEIGYNTMRDTIMSLFRGRGPAVEKQTIWALHDVTFTANHGDAIGIVGRNGAGKSTLLKILSRITEPSGGVARLYGRVGSLLEVGTGFHPELTGRENVFLNGAILGMRRAEIARKLDEIVAFAEMEQFLDTPVKRYSSGMYVRLAFAVAAHLDTDILIVDEVLAVGDANFQRKCLAKMEDAGAHGRTVLFVSHNASAVTRLCNRAILLEKGRVVADGRAHDVIRQYLRSDVGTRAMRVWEGPSTPGNHWARLRSIRLEDASGTVTDRLDIRSPATIVLEWDVLQAGRVLIPGIGFTNEQGVVVFVTHDLDPAWRNVQRPLGRYISRVAIPGNFLAEGTFIVSVSISTIETAEVHAAEADVIVFDVIDNFSGDSARGDYGGDIPGIVRPLLSWTNEVVE
ncbi:MAG TPA: ABC transporter ATP-binding protein [Thermoanaerobaculia bacterium]|nr:ABC transporter ATP-binding protein [Thermoanaerobaculia bacterium]